MQNPETATDQDNSGLQTDGDESQRKLVILGIPWETQSETLRTYFSQFCPVQDAVVMRDRYSGKSRGFGFVTFYSASDANRVAAAEHVVDGRRCDAKLALPRGGGTNAAGIASSQVPVKVPRIFVARVPQTITDEQFKAYWEDFGPVEDAYMPKDVSKAGHRGIGFVTFVGVDALERVMATTHTLHGTELAVDRAEPKASERFAAAQQMLLGRAGAANPALASAMLLQSLPEGFVRAAAGSSYLPSQSHYERRDPELPASLDEGNNTGSTSQAANSSGGGQSLGEAERTALEQYALASQGMGSVDPQRLQLAQSLLQQQAYARGGSNNRAVQALQGLTFGGSNAGIGIGLGMMNQGGGANAALGNGRGMDSLDPSWQLMQAARTSAGMLPGDTRGRPPPTPPSGAPPGGGGGRPSGPRIFVGKLNKDTTEGDVKDYFGKFGYVLDVYMPRDKMNRSDHRGFGFVTFETEGALARIMQHETPHQIRGSIVAIDDAAPRREDGTPQAAAPSYSGGAQPQAYAPSHGMDGLEHFHQPGPAVESMGPDRRHPEAIRNGYKPY